MLTLNDKQRAEIATMCRQFGAVRLDLCAEAMTGTYDPARGDIDFVAVFSDRARQHAFDNYFGLKEALSAYLGRPIDLITASPLRNPVLSAEIAHTAELVYAEAH